MLDLQATSCKPRTSCGQPTLGLLYDMKKLLWSIFVLITLLIFIGLTSCFPGGDEDRPGMKINTDLLVGKIWSVSFFEDNGADETAQFSEVYLQFLPNFRLAVIKGCETVEGEWILSTDSTLLVIRMPVDVDPPLDQLSDEWIITRLTENNLNIIEQDDKGDEEFHLQTAPLRALSCQDCSEFTNILTDSVWSVTLLENTQVTQTDQLKGFYLQFFTDGTFTASSDNLQANGEWAVTDNCQKLVLEWQEVPTLGNALSDLAKDWIILQYDSEFMSFEADDESGTLMEMKKGRFPGCTELINSLHNTSWYISFFAINSDVITPQFTGTGLTFLPNNQLATEVVIGPAVLGTWLLAGDCDELILDIQAGLLTELSQQWIIEEIDDQIIKLVYEENTLRMEMHLRRGIPPVSFACTKVIDFLKDKTWKVESFLENESDDTDSFEDYYFKFNLDGSFIVLNDNQEEIGSWSLIRGCTSIDINVDNSGPLHELNHSWKIESYGDSQIKLIYSQSDDYKELILEEI